MQPWDTVKVTKEEDSYTGEAGCVVRVDRKADPAHITVRMDKDGAEVGYVESDLQRLS